MALWQIFDAKGVAQVDQFDDGLNFMPDEDGFSTAPVAAHAASLGKGYTFNMIGVPGWHARVEAEEVAAEESAKAAAARDRIAQILDPEGYAAARVKAAREAELAELLQHASPAEKKQLAAAFAAEA